MEFSPPQPRVLLVSRCGTAEDGLQRALRDRGIRATQVPCGDRAVEELSHGLHDLVVLHACGPGEDGFATLIRARAIHSTAEFLVVDDEAHDELRTQVESLGAARYLAGPVDVTEMWPEVEVALARSRHRREARHRRWLERQGCCGMVGESKAMQRVFDLIDRVAGAAVPVLITGETGTGKELVARAIHKLSPRTRRPFVPVGCAAVPDHLVESTLFGHVRGSFTGAVRDQQGLFERAAGGTVLLDDVECIGPAFQAKLLRAVQDRTIQRVGDRHDLPLDFRLLSATNVNLAERVRDGSFRGDLYYRLNVFPIDVPPLRERPDDIPLLAAHFRDGFAASAGLEALPLPNCCVEWLVAYRWPGNVRELKHVMERAVLLSRGEPTITCESLAHLWGGSATMSWSRPLAEEWSLDRLERAYTAQVLKKTGGNKGEAARILGIDRRTLYRKLRQNGDGSLDRDHNGDGGDSPTRACGCEGPTEKAAFDDPSAPDQG